MGKIYAAARIAKARPPFGGRAFVFYGACPDGMFRTSAQLGTSESAEPARSIADA
ncbi:hypothetical protein [Azospirillum doebereinerae]